MNQAVTLDFSEAIRAVADAGMLISEVTVRQDLLTQDAIGEQVEGSPPASTTVVDGAACMIGSPSVTVLSAVQEEIPTGDLTRERELRQVNLDDYYPDVERSMTAEIDEQFYNILGVVHDSQKTRTILVVEASE